MKNENNLVYVKSIDFSVRIVNLSKYLCSHNEFIIANQILRCGTSIGANTAESQEAQSKADFIAKLYISLKEARETEYWIIILNKTDYISSSQRDSLMKDLNEIISLLTAIILSTKNKIHS